MTTREKSGLACAEISNVVAMWECVPIATQGSRQSGIQYCCQEDDCEGWLLASCNKPPKLFCREKSARAIQSPLRHLNTAQKIVQEVVPIRSCSHDLA